MAINGNVIPLGVFAFVTGLIGIVMLVLAARTWLASRALLRDGVRAVGRVVAMKEIAGSGTRSRSTWAPIFEFTGDDGRTRSLLSDSSSNPPDHKVGDSVRVIFKRGEADQARIESFTSLWLGPVALLVFAGGAFLFCITCTVVLVRR